MNPFEMVVLIVAIVMVASIFKSRHLAHGGNVEVAEEDRGESRRLKEEVAQLKDRIKVLERIAVDKENTLSREIDDLRNR